MEKTLQGKKVYLMIELCAFFKKKKKSYWSIKRRSACEGTEKHEYYKMDNPTKLNIMFWNTPSPSISSSSVTLQRKMELQKKTPIMPLSLRHIQALVIQLEWLHNSKVIWWCQPGLSHHPVSFLYQRKERKMPEYDTALTKKPLTQRKCYFPLTHCH